MSTPSNSAWKTRLGERGFPDGPFDIEFWQEQGDEAIFAAAWELVELAQEIRLGSRSTLEELLQLLNESRRFITHLRYGLNSPSSAHSQ